MLCEDSKDSMEEEEVASVNFKDGYLFVNGHEISYEDQMLTSSRFFLVDLCMDLPMEEGIKDFDNKYFNFMMMKQLIQDL